MSDDQEVIDDDSLPIDLKKLSKFIIFEMNMKKRLMGKYANYVAGFK